jgi:hypothetical protein
LAGGLALSQLSCALQTSFKGGRGAARFGIVSDCHYADADSISKEQFSDSVENTGINAGRTYYSFDFKGAHFVVLDALRIVQVQLQTGLGTELAAEDLDPGLERQESVNCLIGERCDVVPNSHFCGV